MRDCLVTGCEPLIEGLKLPNPGDRHVLAAAIKAGARAVVTSNLRDFPADELGEWDIEARSPDDFVLDQVRAFWGFRSPIVHFWPGISEITTRSPPIA